jgi:hypothetical protein
MDISDLFADLSYGELSSLALSEEGTGLITDAGKERIIRFANDGLIKLYSRFVLSEKDVLIQMIDGQQTYWLLQKYAQSQAASNPNTTSYIMDMGGLDDLFLEDVIKILNVFDSYGRELPLNDEGDPLSVFTPQGNMLQVPTPIGGKLLSIAYQAKHVPLTLADLTQVIVLPDVLVPALRNWIAYRAYGQIKTQESMANAQDHLNQYEACCNEVVSLDLVGTSLSTTNERFERNGWK